MEANLNLTMVQLKRTIHLLIANFDVIVGRALIKEGSF